MTDSTLSGNSAGEDGGAIDTRNGHVIVNNSTLSGNTASDGGGGALWVRTDAVAIVIVNSTLSGNTASFSGGAIYVRNTGGVPQLSVVNSTITGNYASNYGGGIVAYNADVTIHNSIVAGNTVDYVGPDLYVVGYLSSLSVSHSLIGDNADTGLVDTDHANGIADANGNFIGGATFGVIDVSTVLNTTLALNGAPVGSPLTHALLPGSLALNSGNNAHLPLDIDDLDGDMDTAELLPFDQRGAGFDRINNTTVDMGAFEEQPTLAGLDFGDLPDTYGTLLASDGARHTATGPMLGTARDTEADGQPTIDATGDGSDEDGVVAQGPLVTGSTTFIDITSSGAGFVNAWADLNFDGDFDPEEQILLNHAVSAGVNTVAFVLPPNFLPQSALPIDVMVRYRLTSYSVASPSPTGLELDGEVEDYVGTIYDPTFVLWGDTLTSTGTSDDDVYILDLGARTLSVNGVVRAIPLTITNFVLNSGAGFDTLTILGSSGAEDVRLLPSVASLNSSSGGLTGSGSFFEEITYRGNGGADVATLVDSAGADTLTGGLVGGVLTFKMQGTGFVNKVEGVTDVNAAASRGGFDTAVVDDSSGDDTFIGRPTVATLAASTFNLDLFTFESVQVTASGGADRAILKDDATNSVDALVGRATGTSLTGVGYSLSLFGFDYVWATSNGGDDTALLIGTAGFDAFRGELARAVFSSGGVDQILQGFAVVTFNGRGGNDRATFVGSTGDDTLSASPSSAQFLSGGFEFNTVSVEDLRVNAGAGTGDFAVLTDSAGNDLFSGITSFGDLTGSGYAIRTSGFETIRLRGVNGGTNTRRTTLPLSYFLIESGTWV